MKKFLYLAAALLLAGCSNRAKMEQPTSETGDDGASFADLFGIDEQRASRELPASVSQCLHRAHEDFSLALKGKDPRHAKQGSAASDGGTTVWEDPCYTLDILRSLSRICEKGIGLEGAIVG